MSEEMEWHYISEEQIAAIGFVQFASFIHVFKDDGTVLVAQRKDTDEDSFEEEDLHGIEILCRCVEMIEGIKGIDGGEIHIELEEPRDNLKRGMFDSMYIQFGVAGTLNVYAAFNTIHMFNKSLSMYVFCNKYNEGRELYRTIANLIKHANNNPTEVLFLSDDVYIRSMGNYVSIAHDKLNNVRIQSND